MRLPRPLDQSGDGEHPVPAGRIRERMDEIAIERFGVVGERETERVREV